MANEMQDAGWTPEEPQCPIHARPVPDCPGCSGYTDQLDYDLLSCHPTSPSKWRKPTAEERNHAQPIRSALELWNGGHLSCLADLSPRSIAHAMQVVAYQFKNLDGDMAAYCIIHLLATELRKARGEQTIVIRQRAQEDTEKRCSTDSGTTAPRLEMEEATYGNA